MTVGGMGFIPERLLMMMMMNAVSPTPAQARPTHGTLGLGRVPTRRVRRTGRESKNGHRKYVKPWSGDVGPLSLCATQQGAAQYRHPAKSCSPITRPCPPSAYTSILAVNSCHVIITLKGIYPGHWIHVYMPV